MAPVKKQYIKQIKEQHDYHVTWHPGVPLAIGDIGVFDSDGAFERLAALKTRGIDFDICDDAKPYDINHESSSGVETIVKTSGSAPVAGSVLKDTEAGVMVKFSKAGSIILKTKNAKHYLIDNVIKLKEDILELFSQDKWDEEWCVITELVKADSGTILISNSADSEIELKANANAQVANIDIADAAFKFSVGRTKNLSCQIIAEGGLTPLFKVKKLTRKGFVTPKKRLFGKSLAKIDVENTPKYMSFSNTINDNYNDDEIEVMVEFELEDYDYTV